MEKGEKVKEIKECCSTRDVLWYLVFIGFAVNYMIRINLNIAIVSMVKQRPKSNVSLTSECIAENVYMKNTSLENVTTVKELQSQSTVSIFNANLGTTVSWRNLSSTTIGSLSQDNTSEQTNRSSFKFESRKFDWNEKEQGSILGSFFYLHWLTQIPGGILAGKYGTKIVFGLSNFTGVLCCLIIPFFAYRGPIFLIGIRIFQGLLCGFAWPAMHNLTARWIPPNERSKFVTAYLGSSVGAAITYPICGFIIDRWGWELVFYVCGILGTLWFIAWWFLVYDSPAEHPRISENEKEYIINSLGHSVAKNKAPVPWNNILTDTTVWMNILGQFGGVWGLFTLMTHAPTYFKFIHGWNIKATGLLSGMPHIFRMLWAYVFSHLGDYLLRSNKMSRSNVRKLATAACCIVQGVFMLALAYSGCNYNSAIIFLTLAIVSHGAVSTGPLASVVDISPNYAGVILGAINTIVAMVGFLTPLLVGYLTFQNQTVGQWQKVFWVAAVLLFACGILYCIFAKSELKPWNSPEKQNGLPESEMMVIKTTEFDKEVENKSDYKKVPEKESNTSEERS